MSSCLFSGSAKFVQYSRPGFRTQDSKMENQNSLLVKITSSLGRIADKLRWMLRSAVTISKYALRRSAAILGAPPGLRMRMGYQRRRGFIHDKPDFPCLPRTAGHKLFQLPLIMARIVSKIPVSELLVLRSTCKLWNTYMVPQLRSKHRRLLTGNFGLSTKRVNPLVSIAALTETFCNSNDIPFGTLMICVAPDQIRGTAWRNLFTEPRGLRALTTLWGQHLHTLHIAIMGSLLSPENEWSSVSQVNSLRNLIFLQTPGLVNLSITWLDRIPAGTVHTPAAAAGDAATANPLPRLRWLHLSVVESEPMSQFVVDVLRSAPGLGSLSTKCSNNRRPYSLLLVLRYMEENPAALPCLWGLQVETLHRECIPGLISLSRRGENPLRLTYFKADIYYWQTEVAQQITEFLTLQSQTLIDLVLKVGYHELVFDAPAIPGIPDNLWPSFVLPDMTALKRLQIEALGSPKIMWGTFPSDAKLRLSIQCQALTENSRQTLDHLNEYVSSLSTVPITELCIQAEIESSELLDKLATTFPWLTRLTISLHQDLFSALWSKWPALEFLEVKVLERDRELDSDLTGIPPEQCARLREQILESVIDYKEARRVKTSLGIQDMGFLRGFVLKTEAALINLAPAARDKYHKTIITDVSGYFGFAQLPQLQTISIKKGTLSEVCVAAIRRCLGLCCVITQR